METFYKIRATFYFRKIIFFLLLGISGSTFLLAAEVPSKERFARTCLVVEEAAPGQQGEFQTTLFDNNSRPGPGQRLSLYLDSSVDTYALVTLFSLKNQKLMGGWLPELVKLKAWEESRLPEESVNWDWAEHRDDFEIHVIFVTPAQKEFQALKSLIDSMHQSKTDRELLDLQTVRLRELMDGMISQKTPIIYEAAATPPAWGGTLRGLEFHWQQNSHKTPLDEKGHGYIVYPVSVAADH